MAAFTLRKALSTKPFSSLFNSSQISFFSTTLSPPFSSFRAAQSTIVSLSDPNKIADILISQIPFSAFTRYRPIYPYAIRKLARAHRFDLVERIVDQHLSMAKDKGVSEGFVIRFIMLYAEAGMVDHSLRLFNDFANLFRSSEKFVCAILTAMLKNSKFDEFHDVFIDAHKIMSISPGVKACNLKLRAYCEEGKVGLAEELLEKKMEKEFRVSPDIHSYNVLLGAYLKENNLTKFDEITGEVLRRGLESNVTTYRHRIVRLCKGEDCAGAREFLDEMMAKDIKPNAACYNWIIYGYSRTGDFESANMVLERMISDGYAAPSSLTYYTVFRHMVQEGQFVSALSMCKVILKRKWVPPFEAMEGLVKGLLEMSEKKEACKVVKKMKKRLHGPALESWVKIEAALPWGV